MADGLKFACSGEASAAQPLNTWNASCLPGVAALPSTLVRIELLLNEPIIDLQALADVVMQDTNLAFQLQHLSNADRHPDNHLLRIEECLVDLGIDWLLAMVRSASAVC
jgi:HD-like signal output (HDOD) protein